MRKLAILPAFFILFGCANNQYAVKYAMDAWETLDEAFFSWASLQPSIIQYLVDQDRLDEAKQVYETFKSAVSKWIKIKDQVEALLTKAATGDVDAEAVNKLFTQARDLLREVGALRGVPQ